VNEFTIEPKDVEFFSVGDTDLRTNIIRPTERSQTAGKFNELRDKLTWSKTELVRLRDEYNKMKDPSPVTKSRLDILVDAAGNYPKLFSTGD